MIGVSEMGVIARARSCAEGSEGQDRWIVQRWSDRERDEERAP